MESALKNLFRKIRSVFFKPRFLKKVNLNNEAARIAITSMNLENKNEPEDRV